MDWLGQLTLPEGKGKLSRTELVLSRPNLWTMSTLSNYNKLLHFSAHGLTAYPPYTTVTKLVLVIRYMLMTESYPASAIIFMLTLWYRKIVSYTLADGCQIKACSLCHLSLHSLLMKHWQDCIIIVCMNVKTR